MTRLFPFDPSVAQALPALVTMQIGPNTVRLTTAGFNVIVENGSSGFLYEPWPGADLTGIQFPTDGNPANADLVLQAVPDSLITPGMGVSGLLDGWPITIELFDPGDLASGTFIVLSGTIGAVDETTNGLLTIAANGQLRLASERAINEKYSLTGRESLGDDRCKVPICCGQDISFYDIQRNREYVTKNFNDGTSGLLLVIDCYGRVRTGTAGTVEDYANVYYECTTSGTTDSVAPTYTTTPGDTITDGTAVFTCRNAWIRYCRGHALDSYNIKFDVTPPGDSRDTDITWYALGKLFVRSGNYSGYPAMQISEWDPTNNVATLYSPIIADSIPANTQFEIVPGCDKTYTMCFNRFDNIRYIRAEFLVPPPVSVTNV